MLCSRYLVASLPHLDHREIPDLQARWNNPSEYSQDQCWKLFLIYILGRDLDQVLPHRGNQHHRFYKRVFPHQRRNPWGLCTGWGSSMNTRCCWTRQPPEEYCRKLHRDGTETYITPKSAAVFFCLNFIGVLAQLLTLLRCHIRMVDGFIVGQGCSTAVLWIKHTVLPLLASQLADIFFGVTTISRNIVILYAIPSIGRASSECKKQESETEWFSSWRHIGFELQVTSEKNMI